MMPLSLATRRDDEARDRSDALLKGNTIEETMANVYDHIQEREARKERTAVLTSLPEPDLGGDTIEETMANVYDHIQEREARKDRSAVLTSLPEPDIGGDTIEETLSKTYDVIQARNRRDKEARDRRAAPLKGTTFEETLGNVYDHIQEREANKDRSAVLTNRPEREFGGDRIEETNVWDRMHDKSEPELPRGWSVPSDQSVPRGWGVPRERGVLWDGAKTKPSWGRQPKMPLAPTLDQVRGHLQVPEPPVDQRPTMNPLTARAPRNPFGPQPITPPAVPGWGALTQPRPVGPQGPQVQYVPGLMPWSGTGPWSEAPIAPVIPLGQRFKPGAPAPGTFDPNVTLPPVFGPPRGPIGWAGKSPGVFDQQRGRVKAVALRPDRRTKLAPDIEYAVLMGYMPDPRFAQVKYRSEAGPSKTRPVPEENRFQVPPLDDMVIRNDEAGKGHFGADRGDRQHQGIDIKASPGASVRSLVSGTVIRPGTVYNGNPEFTLVWIQADDGTVVGLYYVESELVAGDRIEAGMAVGTAQNIAEHHGGGMENHVHIEVRPNGINGGAVDPALYLPGLELE